MLDLPDRVGVDLLSAQSAALDWGDVPTWVTAGTALVALAAAIIAARASWAVLKLERVREDRAVRAEQARQDREAREAQADRVAAWYRCFYPEDPLLRPGKSGHWGAHIRNGSALPVYDLRVDFVGPDGTTRAHGDPIAVVPPGDVHSHPEGRQALLAHEHDEAGVLTWLETGDQIRLRIKFRDAAGRHWSRDESGVLSEVLPLA